MGNDNKCTYCPYYGVVDVDLDGNLVWACTRNECIDLK